MKVNNIDILQSTNNNPVAVNVYSKSETDVGLNLKSHKNNTYSKNGCWCIVIYFTSCDR